MTPTPDRLRLATRGSRLARVQTDLVAAALKQHYPGLEIDVVVVTTTGDKDQRPFAQIGGKGLFTSEVERAVVEGEADAAVHSAKDLTAELAPGCTIAAIPTRARAHDVVVGGEGISGEERLAGLAPGARVGTSSMRRRSLLAEMRDGLEVVELRGNLDTRIAKVARGDIDAAILASAGLDRLGSDVDRGPLDPRRWVPPPAQGALAVEALAERHDVIGLLSPLDDPRARAEVVCERAFAARLEGGCSVPLGCHADASEDRIVVDAFLGDPRGRTTVRERISGALEQAAALGVELSERVLQAGGAEILAVLDRERAPEVVEP